MEELDYVKFPWVAPTPSILGQTIGAIERLVFDWIPQSNKIEHLLCCEFDFRTNRTNSDCPLVLVTLNALPLEPIFLLIDEKLFSHIYTEPTFLVAF